ncbi:MAG: threo-3-hydroxy-L-aspartate ammonia-lyase [Rhodothermales bacterium]
MSSTSELAVSFGDVRDAAGRIEGFTRRTPILTSSAVNDHCASQVFFKCENLQNTGSFKFRGAFNALARLNEAERQRGVLSYSSGNHAQALARAGQLLRIPVTIIMPDDAPAVKKAATRGYGADVVEYDRNETTREQLAATLSEERGLPVIPPYNHPDVIAGQGTAAMELLAEHPDIDLLLVCCGGGGLLSGSATAATALKPGIKVVGVEPKAADDATRSFHSGTLQTVHNPPTIADGARTPSLGTLTFPIVKALVSDMVTVSESAIFNAMVFLMQRMKIVVEPTGALAFAALFDGVVKAPDRTVGVIISGGNVDILGLRALRDAAGVE